MNKNEIRLVENDRGYLFNKINFVVAVYSGEQTKKNKMCYQFITYYPPMQNLYAGASLISPTSWQTLINVPA
jgi:hypothetical protein